MSHDDIFKLIFILVIIGVDAFKVFVERFVNIYNIFPHTQVFRTQILIQMTIRKSSR